jgi:hypothetical protein
MTDIRSSLPSQLQINCLQVRFPKGPTVKANFDGLVPLCCMKHGTFVSSKGYTCFATAQPASQRTHVTSVFQMDTHHTPTRSAGLIPFRRAIDGIQTAENVTQGRTKSCNKRICMTRAVLPVSVPSGNFETLNPQHRISDCRVVLQQCLYSKPIQTGSLFICHEY